jgi:hypothetical protein
VVALVDPDVGSLVEAGIGLGFHSHASHGTQSRAS